LIIPYLPFASVFGFVPIAAAFVAAVPAITLLYVATESLKRWFYRAPGGHLSL